MIAGGPVKKRLGKIREHRSAKGRHSQEMRGSRRRKRGVLPGAGGAGGGAGHCGGGPCPGVAAGRAHLASSHRGRARRALSRARRARPASLLAGQRVAGGRQRAAHLAARAGGGRGRSRCVRCRAAACAPRQIPFRAPLHYRPGEVIHIPRCSGAQRAHGRPAAEGALYHDELRPGRCRRIAGRRSQQPTGDRRLLQFRVDAIDCKNAHLTLETSKPGKLPMHFEIARVRLTGIAMESAMAYEAELTNPRPPGIIHASGNLGPLRMDDPGESPLDGKYRFDNADLGTFKGIAGILSSTGTFQGKLATLRWRARPMCPSSA